MFLAGSFANNIAIYAENTMDCIVEYPLEFGVTCAKWSPCGNMMWVGGRRHDDIGKSFILPNLHVYKL